MNLKKSTIREAVGFGLLVGTILWARSSLADHYVVPTGSMRPTVEIDDHVVVNKLAYGVHLPFVRPYLIEGSGPGRGDVVVLDSPVDDIVLLKRVVAKPGDLVSVEGGRLAINGVPVPVSESEGSLFERLDDAEHPIRLTEGGGRDLPATRVPDGKFLVMGDNRGESFDGRYFGFVERARIRGRAIAIYWHDGGPTWRPL